ncbi:LysR family transcriptional regulator [Stutzerimonas stutzeri]|uniref:LysR family transcriptional regulator n=1 Tax=Stutzerimonas stutzeri TaxID=316 RepID=W8RAS8_STUST|nr:LysR family transcriptional regulator [Stutzerimonas stutzeri]AHL75507.1 LysR family transcriptional regulator [Stutzerimonas stutzeri]MCQ4327923.1 LysR family transcriptional regulator [Stutzerimonas stutzeri]
MMKLSDVSVFVATAEVGSITSAARRLGLAKSVVSERLAALERDLGVQLIQRTTRKLSLTESGRCFLPRAQRILREAEEAAAELAVRSGTLSGPLRLAAPVSFGILHFGPALYRFLAQYPEIDVSLELDDRFVDVAAEGFDAVLRHGVVGDTRLIAKRLTVSRRELVASPAYLAEHGCPGSLDELASHRGILYSNRDSDWRFATGKGWSVVRPAAGLRVNNGIVMRDAAIAGLGIALLPTFFVHESLESGALTSMDIGVRAEGAELFLTYPPGHRSSAKIRALADSLRQSFGDPPYWDRDDPP